MAAVQASFAAFRGVRRVDRHDQMTLDVKAVVAGTMGGNESLGLTLRFEPLHFSLSLADRQVKVFHPVIVS